MHYLPRNPDKLLIGAPLGENLQPNTNHSGALYKCPISDYDLDCDQVETDGFREFDYEETEEVGLNPPGKDEDKNSQWMGVTVKSQKPGGNVIVCAHRYVSIDVGLPALEHYGYGLCYILDHTLKFDTIFEPCRGQPIEKYHQQYAVCQAGTSAEFLEDGTALVGAPGVHTWRGSIFAKEQWGSFINRDHLVYSSPINDNPEPIDKYSYLGMSVTGGKFFNSSKVSYVSGAPRSNLTGMVYFFEKNGPQKIMNLTLIIRGKEFGSSYGYTLLAADINNDGYDDLLVAAPFYYDKHHGGKVYVYTNLRKCRDNPFKECQEDQVLHGKKLSRFGFSMTEIGDINKDGYTDVAIGAPYENYQPGKSSGAVYVYSGSKDGLIVKETQVITNSKILTLGYSMSGGLDMDENGYPDFVVGAYESERAILFKTRPIIDIKIDVTGTELKNINVAKKGCSAYPYNTNNTCFTFKSCFEIADKVQKASSNFSIQCLIKELGNKQRVWFADIDPSMPDARKNHKTIRWEDVNHKPYCRKSTVYIEDWVRDFLSPIKFVVNCTLENDRPNSHILNKTSIKYFDATFQKDCGSDDICNSNMILTAGTPLNKTEEGFYIVNMINEEFIVEANVTNTGESAYEAKLFIDHSKDLSYIALIYNKDNPVRVKCTSFNKTLVSCDLGNPLAKNKALFLRVRFEVLKTTYAQQLDVTVFVNSTSVENSRQTRQSFTTILQKIAEFKLRAKTSSKLFVGGTVKGENEMKRLEDIGARVTHSYQIDNTGQWPLHDVNISISWPYQVNSAAGDKAGKWLLYLERMPIIKGDVNGGCDIEDKNAINVLNLTLEKDEPENYTKQNFTVYENETTILSRRRRDVEYVVDPTTIEKGGKTRKVIYMKCGSSAKCVKINCYIDKIPKGNQAEIEIRSRIWNSTLVEDYFNVDWVSIRSVAQAELADKTITISNDTIPYASEETIIYPDIILADDGVSLWMIILAVIAGLLLLILLIFILYKFGFFKRHRVSKDPTLSGNLLLKEMEQDTLLKK